MQFHANENKNGWINIYDFMYTGIIITGRFICIIWNIGFCTLTLRKELQKFYIYITPESTVKKKTFHFSERERGKNINKKYLEKKAQPYQKKRTRAIFSSKLVSLSKFKTQF